MAADVDDGLPRNQNPLEDDGDASRPRANLFRRATRRRGFVPRVESTPSPSDEGTVLTPSQPTHGSPTRWLFVRYKGMVFRVDQGRQIIERWMTEKKSRDGKTYRCGWLMLPRSDVDWNTVWRLRNERQEGGVKGFQQDQSKRDVKDRSAIRFEEDQRRKEPRRDKEGGKRWKRKRRRRDRQAVRDRAAD